MAKQPSQIYLIGEAQLIAECGTFLHQAGYSVTYSLNSGENGSTIPRIFRKTLTVPKGAIAAFELSNCDLAAKRKNIRLLDRSSQKHFPILTSSVAITATEQSTWVKNPSRIIGIGALSTLISRQLIELAPTIHTDTTIIHRTTKLLADAGKEIAIVQDRVGMVMPRILCMLINEAFFALTDNIAAPPDIDMAMKLATNYPSGPIEWANRIGLKTVEVVLLSLYKDLGEDRYRIAPLLRQMSMGAPWWNT